MSDGGINFNEKVENVHTGAGDIKQGENIIEGDVSGDVVSGQKAGEVHGDMTQNRGDTVTVEQQVKDFFDEMTKNAPEIPPLPRGIPQPETVSATPEEAPVVIEDFGEPEEVSFENFEDHPQMVFASVQKMQEAPETVTEEEQKGLFSRCYSCVKKFATSPEAVAALKLVGSGIEATASLTPPLNVLNAVIKTGVSLATKKE